MLKERMRIYLKKRQEPTIENGFGADFIDWAKYYGQTHGFPGLKAGSSSPNPAPTLKVPEMEDAKAETWPGAKKRKVRYGPYRIPPTSEKNLESELMKVAGMSNSYTIGVKKPCEGECTVLSVMANMEYADGSSADNSNGVSLL
jgi:hypothetical protein